MLSSSCVVEIRKLYLQPDVYLEQLCGCLGVISQFRTNQSNIELLSSFLSFWNSTMLVIVILCEDLAEVTFTYLERVRRLTLSVAMELLLVLWILLIALCSVWLLLLRRKQWPGKKVPPGSMGWPIIGETLEFFAAHKISKPEPFFAKRIPRYGDFFRTHILGNPAVVCTNPEVVRFIVQNEGRLFRASYPASLKQIIGKWITIFTELDYWKRQRQVLLGFMHGKLKDSFLVSVEESVLEVMSTWKTSNVVAVATEAKALTFSVVIKQILSCRLEDVEMRRMLDDFTVVADGAGSIPIFLPGTRYYKGLQARKKILANLLDKMEKRKSDEAEGEHKDFLGTLVACGDYDAEQILDFLMNILFGGFETTSAGITLAVKYIKDNPEVLAQLREEHEAIRKAKKEGEKLTWDDYLSMTFTQKVILETLRCGNIAYALFRKALEDIQIGEWIIPKGWDVIASIFAVHTDPKLYPDPFKFNPWRWENASTKNFFGFGGGPRQCPGSELGKLEISIFLHYLVTRFSWEDVQPQDVVIDATVRVPNGLLIQLIDLARC